MNGLRRRDAMQKGRNNHTRHVTTGNVLDDLGFAPEIALELKLKAELHSGILKLIHKHKLTPRLLENCLGIQQPRVSELMRGKLHTIGIKKLLEYADKLGAYAKVILKEKAAAA
jgi:predicted XRE-type DNA-binding protein